MMRLPVFVVNPSPRAVFAAAFLACFLVGGMFLANSSPPLSQPIAFNHSKHVENGLGCADCHPGARAAAKAGLPDLGLCLTCHETALTQSAEEAKVRKIAAEHRELLWTSVTRVPAHVYFSHRRHTELAKMECSVCHGAMEKLTVPPGKPFRNFTMETCTECHRKNKAGNDCNDCHR